MQGGETPDEAGRRDGETGGASGGGGKADVAADGPAFGRRSDEVDEPGRGGGGGANPLPVEETAGAPFPCTILPLAARLAGAAIAVTADVADGPEAGGGSAKCRGGYGFAPFGLDDDDDEDDKGALPFTDKDVVVPAAAPCPSAGAI